MGSVAATTQPKRTPQMEEPQDNEDEQDVDIPSLDGLQVEIEQNKAQGVSFESLMATAELAAGITPEQAEDLSISRPTAPKGKKLSKKAQAAQDKRFLDDFRKEAGTNRQSPN
jgi:hypothetical protein